MSHRLQVLVDDAGFPEVQRDARPAVHVATMDRQRIARIMMFDAGFDSCPGVTRIRTWTGWPLAPDSDCQAEPHHQVGSVPEVG